MSLIMKDGLFFDTDKNVHVLNTSDISTQMQSFLLYTMIMKQPITWGELAIKFDCEFYGDTNGLSERARKNAMSLLLAWLYRNYRLTITGYKSDDDVLEGKTMEGFSYGFKNE